MLAGSELRREWPSGDLYPPRGPLCLLDAHRVWKKYNKYPSSPILVPYFHVAATVPR